MPVDLEPLGAVEAYGADRAFVRIALDGGTGRRPRRARRRARGRRPSGHPDRRSTDPIDLGAEFVRWEVATAIAGAVLGIDPFDQPNVEEAKELTRDVLERRHDRRRRRTPRRPPPIASGRRPRPCTATRALRLTAGDGDVVGELARHLARRRPNAYLALQAFIAPTPARDEALARIRRAAARPDRPRHDRRLRPALPALDRPAPQGRRRRSAGSSS